MSYSPLHDAAFQGLAAQLAQCLQDGAKVNELAFDSTTALHHAAAKGQTEAVEFLLKNGARYDVVDNTGSTPIHHAAFAGQTAVLKLLAAAGANIEKKTETEGATPLHLAAFAGQIDSVNFLIHQHVDVNCRTKAGDTPLHKACYMAHSSLIPILLEAGAIVGIRDLQGMSPLHYAAYAGSRESVRHLLTSSQINVNLADNFGRTPLHIAAIKGYSECVLALISQQARIDVIDAEGNIPLKYAEKFHHEACARLLLDEDAEINRLYEAGCSTPSSDTLVEQADRYGFLMGRDSELRILPGDIKKRLMSKEEERSRKWAAMVRNWKQVSPKLLKSRIRKGIPDCVRGEGWKLITNAANLMVDKPNAYKIISQKAGSQYIKQIDLDILRTCRNHIIFIDRYGQGQQSLFNLLKTYSIYNEEVGYCQGMSSVVALLLMYMEEEAAFWVLDLLMEKYSMKNLFRAGFPQLLENFYIHERLMQRFIPRIHQHFINENVVTSMYGTKWYLMVFLHCIPFSATLRVWDVMFYEGYRIVFAVAIGLLKMHEKQLLALDFEQLMEFLSTMSERYLDCDRLMSTSLKINAQIRNNYFQRLQNDYLHREA